MSHSRGLTHALVGLVVVAALAGACGPGRVAELPSPPGGASRPAGDAKRPTTPEEIFTYTGPDRQQTLEDGARKEGALLWYSSQVARYTRPLADAFRQKYPFLKVDLVRPGGGLEIVTRVVEEYRANKHDVDVVDGSLSTMTGFKEAGILTKFTSPELDGIPKEATDAESYFFPYSEAPRVLQYNRNLVPDGEAPKSFDDLLIPKWKGKLATHGSSQGIEYLGALLHIKGEDYVRKLAQQDITNYITASGSSMAELVTAGEVPMMFPGAIGTAVELGKQGAPIGWSPLDQAPTVLFHVALPVRSSHPHAAALFADFLLSEDGQKARVQTGLGAVRKGIQNPYPDFKKLYVDFLVPEKDYQKEYKKWADLHKQLFVKRAQ